MDGGCCDTYIKLQCYSMSRYRWYVYFPYDTRPMAGHELEYPVREPVVWFVNG